MKKDINEVLLVGTLVSRETRSTAKGTPLANIVVEVTRRVWDREIQEFRSEPQQIPVVVWGADACYALEAVRVGQQRLLVRGEVRNRQWTTADGRQRQRLEIFSTWVEPIVDVSIQSQQEIEEISDFSDLTGLDKCQD